MLSKRILPGLPATLSLVFLLACGGRSEQAEVTAPKVYVGGTQSMPYNVPGYWVDKAWVGLQQTPDSGGWVETMAVSGGDVYTAGWSYSSKVVNIGYWRNSGWVALTPPSGTDSAEIRALAVSGGDVYAAATAYTDANRDEEVPGYWKNGQWTSLPVPAGASTSINAMTVSEGATYIGGRILMNGTSEPGYWRNGTWVGLPGPDGPTWGFVGALAVAGKDVYATGLSTSGSGYWKNGVWIELNPSGDAQTITIAGGEVLLGGQVRDTSSADGWIPGYWRNGVWTGLPLPSGAYSGNVTSVALWGTDVYASGYALSRTADFRFYTSVAGYWRNGTWEALPQSLANNLNYAHAIVLTR